MQEDFDFKCLNCKSNVDLNIYGQKRNHCPNCLYSLHTDIFPGDNANDCLSLMKPISTNESSDGNQYIMHKCNFCGKTSKSDIDFNDDYDKVFELTKKES